MGANSQFKPDSMTVDGVPYNLVDNATTITGIMDQEATVVASASGPDAESYTRVPRQIRTALQFVPGLDTDALSKKQGARIVLKDSRGPRRLLATNCSTASMGEAGNGPLQVVFNALDKYQWI